MRFEIISRDRSFKVPSFFTLQTAEQSSFRLGTQFWDLRAPARRHSSPDQARRRRQRHPPPRASHARVDSVEAATRAMFVAHLGRMLRKTRALLLMNFAASISSYGVIVSVCSAIRGIRGTCCGSRRLVLVILELVELVRLETVHAIAARAWSASARIVPSPFRGWSKLCTNSANSRLHISKL